MVMVSGHGYVRDYKIKYLGSQTVSVNKSVRREQFASQGTDLVNFMSWKILTGRQMKDMEF